MYDPEQLPVFLGDTKPARPIRCIRLLIYSHRYLLPEDPDDFVVYSQWDWYVFVSPRDVFNHWDDDRVEYASLRWPFSVSSHANASSCSLTTQCANFFSSGQ